MLNKHTKRIDHPKKWKGHSAATGHIATKQKASARCFGIPSSGPLEIDKINYVCPTCVPIVSQKCARTTTAATTTGGQTRIAHMKLCLQCTFPVFRQNAPNWYSLKWRFNEARARQERERERKITSNPFGTKMAKPKMDLKKEKKPHTRHCM